MWTSGWMKISYENKIEIRAAEEDEKVTAKTKSYHQKWRYKDDLRNEEDQSSVTFPPHHHTPLSISVFGSLPLFCAPPIFFSLKIFFFHPWNTYSSETPVWCFMLVNYVKQPRVHNVIQDCLMLNWEPSWCRFALLQLGWLQMYTPNAVLLWDGSICKHSLCSLAWSKHYMVPKSYS